LIIGYDIVENSGYRLFGERKFAGGGAITMAKLTLDKVHGRIVQSGMRRGGGGDSDELVEIMSGRCSETKK